ncbi:MAG: hypothetical protein HONBIEJF_01518 [Fimbriimonadaceae bacterium]|nr:hypothetical protein [Fimbriimonadaceae bacterium]
MSSIDDRLSDDLSRLVDHLKRHPHAVHDRPQDLAEKLGMPIGLVAKVLAERAPRRKIQERRSSDAGKRFGAALSGLFASLTSNPVLFNAITFLLMLVGLAIASDRSFAEERGYRINSVTEILILVGTLMLHWGCFFRHGRARYVFQSTLAIYAILTPVLLVIGFALLPREMTGSRVELGLMILLSLAVLCGTYLFVGLTFSLVGGYFHIRQVELEVERLTRQELLQRFFEIQERMSEPSEVVPEHPLYGKNRFLDGFRVSPLSRGVVLGMLFGIVEVALTSAVAGRSLNEPGPMFMRAGVGVLATLGFMGAAFVSGTPVRGIATALAGMAGMLAIEVMPIGHFGPDVVRDLGAWGFVINVALTVALGGAAGLGAFLEERAHRQKLLDRNDPETLVSEMVKIQRLLNPGAKSVCVMVVDVARSTDMKSGADPLRAEWTFREYQNLLQDIVLSNHGKVHSTAGDGMVAAFDTCEAGLAAARQIQHQLQEFNLSTNRLVHPFRLRIGLHYGTITGSLDDVQFTRVIDVAAHAERFSQLGGIAVTDAVATHLPAESVAELVREIDGHRLFMVLDPISEP